MIRFGLADDVVSGDGGVRGVCREKMDGHETTNNVDRKLVVRADGCGMVGRRGHGRCGESACR